MIKLQRVCVEHGASCKNSLLAENRTGIIPNL